MDRTQSILRKAFFLLFSFLFTWTCYHVIFVSLPIRMLWRKHLFIFPPLILFLVIVACIFLFFVFRKISSLKNLTEKNGQLILIGFMAVSTIISITIGLMLRYEPIWDLGAIYNGGVEWALTGDFPSYHIYFARNPNNIPTLFLFRCIFVVFDFFGGKDHFAAMVVFAVLLIQVSVYAAYDTVRRLLDIRAAIMALLIIAIYLPVYTMGAAFYTDVLSLPFITLALNLYLRLKTTESFKHKLILVVLFGLLIGFGTILKTTVLIIFIACLIDWTVNNKNWKFANIKSNALLIGAATLIIAVIMISSTLYSESLISDELSYEYRLPTTHFILLGLDKDSGGTYSWDTTAKLYINLENVDVRTAEIKNMIIHRINDFGFFGLIRHFGIKLGLAFESGAFEQAWHFGANHVVWIFGRGAEPTYRSVLHEVVLPTGILHPVYNHLTTALMLAMLIFAIASALIRSLARPFKLLDYQFCAPWVAFIGLAFFLMISETGNRFPLGFFSLLIICTVQGLYDTRLFLESRKKEKSKSETNNVSLKNESDSF